MTTNDSVTTATVGNAAVGNAAVGTATVGKDAVTTPTEFKAVPDLGDLKQLQRDLRFHPCVKASPRRLTVEQNAGLTERG